MKEYKLVHINEGIRFSRGKDIQIAEDTINKYAKEGWTLQQVVSPSDMVGALIGIFYKEK